MGGLLERGVRARYLTFAYFCALTLAKAKPSTRKPRKEQCFPIFEQHRNMYHGRNPWAPHKGCGRVHGRMKAVATTTLRGKGQAPLWNSSRVSITPSHGCCWETFYIFAYCGLVVEIQPLNCYVLNIFLLLPFQRQPSIQGKLDS